MNNIFGEYDKSRILERNGVNPLIEPYLETLTFLKKDDEEYFDKRAERELYFKVYNQASAFLNHIRFTATTKENIENLSKDLTKLNYTRKHIGAFLSLAINYSDVSTFEFNFGYPFLGYKLPEGKTIKIKRSATEGVGSDIQGGTIIIGEYGGKFLGNFMKKGLIKVGKSTNCFTGMEMRGGSIKVDGNCGEHVGYIMQGGEIDIKGSIDKKQEFDNKEGGIIRVRGKVVA